MHWDLSRAGCRRRRMNKQRQVATIGIGGWHSIGAGGAVAWAADLNLGDHKAGAHLVGAVGDHGQRRLLGKKGGRVAGVSRIH